MKKYAVIAFLFLVLLASCQSKPAEFAIYLTCEERSAGDLLSVPLADWKLASDPLLTSADLVSYNPQTFELKITESASIKISDLKIPVNGIPVVVMVGGERIYGGALWTPISSLSYEGIALMYNLNPQSPGFQINIGYPGMEAGQIEDFRNDPRILDALKSAGKLK